MYKTIRTRFCAILAAILLAAALLPAPSRALGGAGEERYAAAVYDNASGMLYSEANLTIQTPDGFIYIGSYGGLTRFDGRGFEAVEGVSSAVSLYVDSRDRLWAGTSEMGAVCIDGGSLAVYGPEQGLTATSVRGFYETENGELLMAASAGLFVLDGEGRIREIQDARFAGRYILSLTGDGLGNVYGVVRDEAVFQLRDGEIARWWTLEELGFDTEVVYPDPARSGYVYFGTEGSELYYGRMDAPISELERIELGGVTGVNCLLKDAQRLWVCAGDGMGYLEDGAFTRMDRLPVRNAFEHIMRDREGNLWISSSRRGVMKLSPGIFTDVTAIAGVGSPVVNAVTLEGDRLYIGTDTGLIVTDARFAPVDAPALALLGDARVRSITADAAGRLWFSTYSALGLVRMDPDTGEYRSFTRADGLPSDNVRDAILLSDGDMLVSTSEGLCRLREGSVIRTYGPADGLNTIILCMCQASDGTVYLGSDGEGLFTLRDDALSPCPGGERLPGGVILNLKYDARRDRVWAVTGRYTLACIADGEAQSIETLPGAEKNASPYYDLIPAEDGKLWLLGCSGICVVSGDALLEGDVSDALLYGVRSGLPHMTAANSRSFVTADGVAFLAGADGVTAVALDSAVHTDCAPKLCVPYVEIDGERVWLRDSGRIVIPREARRIRIYAYALTYALDDPEVRYRLEGFDAEDSVAPASRLPVITYTNLPGGSYTFRFSLAEEGAEELRLELVKEKRVYEYPAVLAAGAAVVLAILVWLAAWLLKRQKRRLEAKAESERINSELRMAANIQADLLPKGKPVFPGHREFTVYASMRPAREIGGDFYDFFLTDDDHLALAVADVSGRGVPAALYMTMTKTLLKNSALHEKSPARVLREVNARLWENHEANMFVSVWLGVLELSTGTLVWADAGHVRPLVRQDGQWSFVEKGQSPALASAAPDARGVDGEAPFADRTLRLRPGDVLFQYTDGVTAAADAQGGAFGEERLLAAMPRISADDLKETAEQLRQEIDGFVASAPQSDDITMLLVRYNQA